MNRNSTIGALAMVLALGAGACDVDPFGGADLRVLVDEARPDAFVVEGDGEVRRGSVARIASGMALVTVEGDGDQEVHVLSSLTEGDHVVERGGLVSIDDADLDPLTAQIVAMVIDGELGAPGGPDALVGGGVAHGYGSLNRCIIETLAAWSECRAQAQQELRPQRELHELTRCNRARDAKLVDCY